MEKLLRLAKNFYEDLDYKPEEYFSSGLFLLDLTRFLVASVRTDRESMALLTDENILEIGRVVSNFKI